MTYTTLIIAWIKSAFSENRICTQFKVSILVSFQGIFQEGAGNFADRHIFLFGNLDNLMVQLSGDAPVSCDQVIMFSIPGAIAAGCAFRRGDACLWSRWLSP